MKIDIIVDKETEKYTISGDKLYYQQQNQIIALDLNDKSEKIIISENKILDFQIAGDNIYYLTYDYKTAVSEVKLQSLSQVDKKTLFSKNDQLFQISVSESTVYFSDNKNNCYKINNNEMSETIVTDDCLAMFVFNNKLYLWNNNVNEV